MILETSITLNDDEGQKSVTISNCQQEDLVCITILNPHGESAIVVIDDLKVALRKLTAK